MPLLTLLAAAVLNGTPQPIPGQPLPIPAQRDTAQRNTAPPNPAQSSSQNTSEATAEGSEILRRVLVDALDSSFAEKPEGDKKTTVRQGVQGLGGYGMVTRLWASDQTVQHARVFHLPDAGLFFALDVSLPVVTSEKTDATEKEKANQPGDDEWERAQREVRGQVSADGVLFRRLRIHDPVSAEIDPKAIDQVVDTVLRTMARHATRVEGLTPRESITVALRLSGHNRMAFQDTWSGQWSQPGQIELYDKGESEDESEADKDEKDQPQQTLAYVLSTGSNVREQNLVIRVAVGDLLNLGEGSIDKLRQRAQVNRY